MKKTIIFLTFPLVSLLLFAGCRTAQVAFPAGTDKTAFTEYDVKGRNSFAIFSGKFSIGSNNVDWTRNAVKTSGSGIFSKENISTSKQDYTISISGPENISWNGKCAAKAEIESETKKVSKRTTETIKIVYSNTLSCSFLSSGRQTFQMNISQDSQMIMPKKTGTVKGENINFEIQDTHGLDGSWNMNNTTGYYITDSGKPVAVVDMLNEGKVYIVPGLKKEKNSVIIAVSAALLGYKDLAE